MSIWFFFILQLTEDAIAFITCDEWRTCCRHVRDVERRLRQEDVLIQWNIEGLVIHVSDDDESTDTASEVESCTDTASEGDSDTDTGVNETDSSTTDSAFEY